VTKFVFRVFVFVCGFAFLIGLVGKLAGEGHTRSVSGPTSTASTIPGALKKGVGWDISFECLQTRLPKGATDRSAPVNTEVILRFHVMNQNPAPISVSLWEQTELHILPNEYANDGVFETIGFKETRYFDRTISTAIKPFKYSDFYQKLEVPAGPGSFDVDLHAQLLVTTGTRCVSESEVFDVAFS